MIFVVCIVHWSLAVTDKSNSPVRLIIPTQSKCSLQLGNSGLGPIPRHIVKNVFTIHLEIFMIIKVSHIVQCAITTTNNVPMVKWVSIFLIYCTLGGCPVMTDYTKVGTFQDRKSVV